MGIKLHIMKDIRQFDVRIYINDISAKEKLWYYLVSSINIKKGERKMKKRVLGIILSLALILTMAACSSKTEEPEIAPEESAPAVEEVPAQEEAAEPEETPAEAPEEVPEEIPEEVDLTIELPIVDEPMTYTLWTGVSPDLSEIVKEISDFSVYQELERRTNIHLDGIVVSAFAETEQFNLMIASGDYCDIINGMSSYTGGLDAAIEEEIIIDLWPLAQEKMPNYMAALNMDESILDDALTVNDRMGCFVSLYTEPKPADSGALIRQDWLDDLGLEAPKTYDDLHEVLTAFKVDKGADAAIIIPSDGTPGDNCLLAGYGVSDGWFQVDGELKYGIQEPGYKDYMMMLNQWYSEGLIWDQFVNLTGDRLTDFTTVLNNETGFWYGGIQDMSNMNKQASDSNFRCYAVADIVMNEGDMNHLGVEAGYVNNTTWAISTACQELDPILKYIDYMYTDEGTILCNYGIEGEAHYLDEDGNPHLSELVTNNPDGLPYRVTVALFCFDKMSSAPFKLDNSKSYASYNQDQMDAMDIWGSTNDNEYKLPRGVTLTTEEQEEYSVIGTDISTFISEHIIRYIVGDESFDTWDDFVTQIEDMGGDRCRELYQGAYDRYLADK